MSLTKCEYSIPDKAAIHKSSFLRLKVRAQTEIMAWKLDSSARIQLALYYSAVGRRSFERAPSEQSAVLIASVYIHSTRKVSFQGTRHLQWNAQPFVSVVQLLTTRARRLLMHSTVVFGMWSDCVWTEPHNIIRAGKLFQRDWLIEGQVRYRCTKKAGLFRITRNGLDILVPT